MALEPIQKEVRSPVVSYHVPDRALGVLPDRTERASAQAKQAASMSTEGIRFSRLERHGRTRTTRTISQKAERAGFEPARRLAYTISNRAHSAGLCDLSVYPWVSRSLDTPEYSIAVDQHQIGCSAGCTRCCSLALPTCCCSLSALRWR